jgi:hypothetical protein
VETEMPAARLRSVGRKTSRFRDLGHDVGLMAIDTTSVPGPASPGRPGYTM